MVERDFIYVDQIKIPGLNLKLIIPKRGSFYKFQVLTNKSGFVIFYFTCGTCEYVILKSCRQSYTQTHTLFIQSYTHTPHQQFLTVLCLSFFFCNKNVQKKLIFFALYNNAVIGENMSRVKQRREKKTAMFSLNIYYENYNPRKKSCLLINFIDLFLLRSLFLCLAVLNVPTYTWWHFDVYMPHKSVHIFSPMNKLNYGQVLMEIHIDGSI